MLEHIDIYRGTTVQLELEINNPKTGLPFDLTALDLELLIKHSHTDKDDVAFYTASSQNSIVNKVEKVDPVNGRLRILLTMENTVDLPSPYMLLMILRVKDSVRSGLNRVFVLKTYVLHIKSV